MSGKLHILVMIPSSLEDNRSGYLFEINDSRYSRYSPEEFIHSTSPIPDLRPVQVASSRSDRPIPWSNTHFFRDSGSH